MNSPGLLLSKSFNMVSTSTFYGEKLHQKVFWNFLEVKMGWNLGPFSLKKLPRYKIPLTVASTIFKWLHIIKRLGCQVNIWSNSFKKSPENLLKRRNITSKSANQKKEDFPVKTLILCFLDKLFSSWLSFILLCFSFAIFSCQDIYYW